MTAVDPTFLTLQTALAGRFSLESEIGRGGMGLVYLARDVLLERPVAIKLLAPALAARGDMRRRFLREARIAAQCFHPNIVPIHEVAEQGDLAWFVMGYVPGETLADRLRRVGPLPVEHIRRIGREIGWALSYAHERGVVHRDVKPENILLEQGTDRALIADFGIAVGEHGSLTKGEDGTDVAGTARFMAPEQALGESIDGRADLYALGVTLYLAATGRYPFEGGHGLALIAQSAAEQPTAVRTHAPQLPESMADAIDRCLAPRPQDRFDTAHDFVTAIERTPAGDELPREAREVRTGATTTMALVDWSVALGIAGFGILLGERSGSLGRAIMAGMLQGLGTFVIAAIALRGGETLLAVKRALARGVPPRDLVQALAPAPVVPERITGPLTSTAMIVGGIALAVAQGQVDQLNLPGALELLGTIITWLVPPVLIQRAMSSMRYTSGVSAWWYSFIRQPIAARVVRWFGGRTAPASAPMPADAPTEVMLGQAAQAILERLPEAQRQALKALPAAALHLAEEAVALRVRLQQLSGEQRALRGRPDANNAHMAALEAEHTAARGRLGTTIAALETIRLDLLRLEAGQTLPGSLTEQLDVVRDLQRRVDADADVRELLQDRPSHALAPKPTPV